MANHVYSVQEREDLPEGRLRLRLTSLHHNSFNHRATCSVVNNSGWFQLRVEETSGTEDNAKPPNTKGEMLFFNPDTQKASYNGLGDTL